MTGYEASPKCVFLALSVAVFVYLGVALFKAERF